MDKDDFRPASVDDKKELPFPVPAPVAGTSLETLTVVHNDGEDEIIVNIYQPEAVPVVPDAQEVKESPYEPNS